MLYRVDVLIARDLPLLLYILVLPPEIVDRLVVRLVAKVEECLEAVLIDCPIVLVVAIAMDAESLLIDRVFRLTSGFLGKFVPRNVCR